MTWERSTTGTKLYKIAGRIILGIFIFLPLVIRSNAPLRHKPGVELSGYPVRDDLVTENVQRRHWKVDVRWDEFELQPGVYALPAETAQVLDLIKGSEFYLNIKVVPQAYRLWPEWNGSPPAPEYWDDLGRAIVELIRITGADYVELLNEPNFRVTEVKPAVQWYFGAAMGPEEGFYEAGYVYGEMLLVVRKIVQEEVPGGDVIAGGLFVDAGYELDNPRSTDYMKGMLAAHKTWRSNKLQACAISMHAYLYHYRVLNNTEAFELPMKYAEYLKKLTGVPVLFSEAAIIKKESYPDTEEFRIRQAEWAAYLKQQVPTESAGINSGKIVGWSWYNWASVWPWEYCAMIRGEKRGDANVQPTMAYEEWSK